MGNVFSIAHDFTLFGFYDRCRFIDGGFQIVIDDDIVIAVDPVELFASFGQAAVNNRLAIGLAAAQSVFQDRTAGRHDVNKDALG